MKIFGALFFVSLVAIAVASQLQQDPIQERALNQHLKNNKRSLLYHSFTSSKPRRLIRKRGRSKGCSTKKKSSSHSESASTSSGKAQSNSKDNGQSSEKTDTNSSSSTKDSKSKSSTTSTSSPSKGSDTSSTSTSKGSASSVASGLINKIFSGQCKNPKASTEYPNGDISFLNCGISKSNPSSKWSPPKVTLNDIKVISAEEAAQSSVFKPCSKYKSYFNQAEKATGIPSVMIMSFAMQESTCNPSETGGNGERGILQLTPDKCKNANCYDAATNIMIGAKYFKSQVDKFDGNVLEAVGAYNGWSTSMSYSTATSQKYGCHAQNNLDYLTSLFNGWLQGKDGNSKEFLVYNNLASCGN